MPNQAENGAGFAKKDRMPDLGLEICHMLNIYYGTVNALPMFRDRQSGNRYQNISKQQHCYISSKNQLV